jgi:NAD-dependent DNA ligase
MKKNIWKHPWPEDWCQTYEQYLEYNNDLHAWKRAYYLGDAKVSDSIYDLVEKMVVYMENTHPEWMNKDSATQQIGYKI